MNETIRIRTDVNSDSNKYLKFQLNQNFDFIEILSLKLRQSEFYRLFGSDYGVIVGRIIANGGVGVPNARVSVFIPISDDDKENQLITGLYPFENINDKNYKGIRYNLLPKKSRFDCHTPVGTFPNKREILDNDVMLEIYEKYYKFTTRTNNAGDFMIFGVPTGNWRVNVDVDLSDIGFLSQRPYDFIRQGKDKKLFETTNKFNRSNNLSSLPQIFHTETAVNVLPFWGDSELFNVGINRLDVELSHRIEPHAFFIGSIFGDNEKNSINKNCQARKNLGNLCDTITSEGTIEIIRKTLNGQIENFSVDGGRLIDENGSWAFQIPMNLDYYVTDEFGNLIPSEDPSKGVPTRARVRFRIGMDVNGTEGRLRQRAKFLVPNNPSNHQEADYSFDENTPDENFRDLYWNKLYTVRSFIPRFQTGGAKKNSGTIRKFLGIKNVDDCGDHSPFPFNRMDTNGNPLFFIMCIIFTIFTEIISFLNRYILWTINVILVKLYQSIFFVAKIACWARHMFDATARENCRKDTCHDLNGTCSGACLGCLISAPLGYIKLQCPSNSNTYYMPWFDSTNKNCGNLNNDAGQQVWCQNNGIYSTSNPDYVECQLLRIADSLGMFKFDFYNDWINGTLYAFLFKHKIKKRGEGKNKFCDYNCDSFPNPTDNNGDGSADNKCNVSMILDTCCDSEQNNCLFENHDLIGHKYADSYNMFPVIEGLIKLYEDEYYYAAITYHDYPLFKTDITLLGSVMDCDIHGIPVIYPKLVNTSYNIPPDETEYLIDENTGTQTILTNNIADLLFDLKCTGIYTEPRHCYNIKKICEIGVGLDELRDTSTPDNIIGNEDIEDTFLRNAIAIMNTGSIDDINGIANQYVNNILTYDTRFGTNHDPSNNNYVGIGYRDFRRFEGGLMNPRLSMGSSYFYYFGIHPGKTGLDRFYRDYVAPCTPEIEAELIINYTSTPVSIVGGNDGYITITVDNGIGPYEFIITYPDGTTSIISNNNNTYTYNNLSSGTYAISVVDASGLEGSVTVFVNSPPLLFYVLDGAHVTGYNLSDGKLIIYNILGGISPYYARIISPVAYATSPTQVNGTQIFSNLPSGTYIVEVYDSSTPVLSLQKTFTIQEPTSLSVTVTTTEEAACAYGNGTFYISVSGGIPPYTLNSYGQTNGINYNTAVVSAPPQTFTITVTDTSGQQVITHHTLNPAPNAMIINEVVQNPTCGNNNGSIIITVTNGVPPLTYKWEKDGIYFANTQNLSLLDADINGTYYTVTVTDANGCEEYKDILLTRMVLEITSVEIVYHSGSIGGGFYGITIHVNGTNIITYYLLDNNGNQLTLYGPTNQMSHTFLIPEIEYPLVYEVKVTDNNGCSATYSITH